MTAVVSKINNVTLAEMSFTVKDGLKATFVLSRDNIPVGRSSVTDAQGDEKIAKALKELVAVLESAAAKQVGTLPTESAAKEAPKLPARLLEKL